MIYQRLKSAKRFVTDSWDRKFLVDQIPPHGFHESRIHITKARSWFRFDNDVSEEFPCGFGGLLAHDLYCSRNEARLRAKKCFRHCPRHAHTQTPKSTRSIA